MVILFLAFPVQLDAQNLPGDIQGTVGKNFPSIIQKAPNTAGIERYGNYEVNKYTGLPEISIPLYTVKSGPITLPISLAYHASGIKYTDQASWVGLGWNLIAGGQISRQIMNLDDLHHFLNNTNDYTVTGFNCFDWYYKQRSVFEADREADIFSYSYPGRSGKFYLRQGGQSPYLFPEAPVDIDRGLGSQFFDITDENGIRYRFGKNSEGNDFAEYTTTTSTTGSGGNIFSGRTGWHLVEIQSPTSADKIEITYQSLGEQTLEDIGDNITVVDQCDTNNVIELPCRSQVHTLLESRSTSTTTNLGIDEIRYKHGKVKFILNTTKRQDLTGLNSLDRIEIYSKIGNEEKLLKTIQFSTSYFDGALRLRLDELIEKDNLGAQVKKQDFIYYTDSFSWDKPQFSKQRDWFGFFNGSRNNTNLLPEQTIYYQPLVSSQLSTRTIGGAKNRESDTTYLKEGVLKRIIHPTKGYTEFQFEPHSYQDGPDIKYGGGLRIKRIENVTGSTTYSKDYYYGENESGVGAKNFSSSLFYYMSESESLSNCGTIPCSRKENVRMYYSNSVIGAGFDESPVVYPIVSEYENNNSENGKIIYEFDNNVHIADVLTTVPSSNKTHRNFRSWERGKLTKKSVYDANDSLVSETEISYTKLKGQNENISQGVVQYQYGERQYPQGTCPIEGGGLVDPRRYSVKNLTQYTGVWMETSRSETIYNPVLNSFLMKKTDYLYENTEHLQATETIAIGSEGEVISTKIFYPDDINGTDSLGGGSLSLPEYSAITQLKKEGQHRIAVPIQKEIWKDNEKLSSERTIYRDWGSDLLLPELIKTSQENNPLENRIRFHDYDNSGNPLIVSKDDGAKISYIWGYDDLLIAEIINSTNNATPAISSFETTDKGGWTYSGTPVTTHKTGKKGYNLSSGSVTKTGIGASSSSPYRVGFWARRSSGTGNVNVGGQTESLTTTWKWVEKTITSSSLTISGSSVIIDELRLHPADAMMTSYTYNPLEGMTSKTDPRGYTLIYEYDPANRLKTIKNEDGHILEHYEYKYASGN